MKVFHLALLFTVVNSFSVAPQSSSRTTFSTTTSLNLFGGKKEQGGGEGDQKGPGFMDQMAMFKKAQEMAQKKQKLDEELTKVEFEGTGADGKVKATFKFVPIKNPMDPNPDYEATKFDFDDDFFESSSPDEISKAVQASIADGIEKTNQAVAEKYAVLQSDLMDALGQKPPPQQ